MVILDAEDEGDFLDARGFAIATWLTDSHDGCFVDACFDYVPGRVFVRVILAIDEMDAKTVVVGDDPATVPGQCCDLLEGEAIGVDRENEISGYEWFVDVNFDRKLAALREGEMLAVGERDGGLTQVIRVVAGQVDGRDGWGRVNRQVIAFRLL